MKHKSIILGLMLCGSFMLTSCTDKDTKLGESAINQGSSVLSKAIDSATKPKTPEEIKAETEIQLKKLEIQKEIDLAKIKAGKPTTAEQEVMDRERKTKEFFEDADRRARMDSSTQ